MPDISQKKNIVGGMVLSKTAPGSGYKKANGQVLSQAAYPELYARIGTQPRFNPTLKTIIPSSLIDVAYSPELELYVGIASSNPGIYTSTDLVNWNAANTAALGVTPTAIAYCADLEMFVVCAGSGSIYTSTDGINWVRQNVFPDTTLSFVACSAALIVVAGASNLDNSILNIWSSADGVTWTKRTLAGTAAITVTALHYSAGLTLFVLGGSAGAIQTSPDGITWTSRTSNISTQINAFASYASLIVAVANTGQISSSPDGATWTSRTTQTGRNLLGVAYSPTATIPWIAVGVSIIMTSTNGTTWTNLEEVYVGTSAIGWDGSQYVGGGFGLSRWTSPDLVTWTARGTPSTSTSHFSLAFGNSIWVAVNNSGAIYTSPDGITWTSRASGVATNLAHVIYVASGINLFIAVGSGNTIITSPDGITWTSRTAAGGTFTSVAAKTTGGDLLVAVSTTGLIFSSPDGVTWTSRASNTGRSLNGVAWNGTVFCAVGVNGTSLTSSDGITWTKQTTSGLPNSSLAWLVSDGTAFYGFVSAIGIVYQSTDGISWQGYACPIDPLGMVFANSQLIIYSANGDLATSTDGKVWTLPANSRGVPAALNKAYWFSTAAKYFVTGSSIGGYLTSTDGSVYRGFNGAISANAGLAYSSADSKLVISGGGLALLSSADGGDTWTPNYTFANSGTSVFNDVAYSPSLDLFVAVGSNALLASSADATTWTQRFVSIAGLGTAPSAHGLNSIVWSAAESLFVAVGAHGTIVTSSNGTAWTERVSGVPVALNQVCYNAALDLFVAVGDAGVVLTSANGTAWTPRPTGFPVNFSAVSSLESLGFVAIGAQGQTYLSADGILWVLTIGAPFSFTPCKSIYSAVDESVFVLGGGASNGAAGWLYSTQDGLTQTQHAMNSSGAGGFAVRALAYDSTEDCYLVVGSTGTPVALWLASLERTYDKDTHFALPVLKDTWIKAL